MAGWKNVKIELCQKLHPNLVYIHGGSPPQLSTKFPPSINVFFSPTMNTYPNLSSPQNMMNSISSFFLLAILLLSSPLCLATRPESSGVFSAELKQNNKVSKSSSQNNKGGGNPGGFNIPGFNIPGWGNEGLGGGYGFGVSGPNGGYGSGGVIQPSVVCKDRGPCFHKKVTCPAKCFDSYSRTGKGWGMGGGGGGCTIDCKKKCRAYC